MFLSVNTDKEGWPDHRGRAGQGGVKLPQSRCINTCSNKYNLVELEGMFLLILCSIMLCLCVSVCAYVCVCVCVKRSVIWTDAFQMVMDFLTVLI